MCKVGEKEKPLILRKSVHPTKRVTLFPLLYLQSLPMTDNGGYRKVCHGRLHLEVSCTSEMQAFHVANGQAQSLDIRSYSKPWFTRSCRRVQSPPPRAGIHGAHISSVCVCASSLVQLSRYCGAECTFATSH
jgi:hypothetical protein